MIDLRNGYAEAPSHFAGVLLLHQIVTEYKMLGTLLCRPLSVERVLKDTDLNGDLVAVHGVLYQGAASNWNDFLLLKKDGNFDGIDIGSVSELQKDQVILVSEVGLGSRINEIDHPACGNYLHKFDAVIIGNIHHDSSQHYPVSITNLRLMILQMAAIPEVFSELKVAVINFSDSRLPELPWTSKIPQKKHFPTAQMFPIT